MRMGNGLTARAALQVARVFRDGTLVGMTDRQILDRFVERHDQTAFEAILAPMVPWCATSAARSSSTPTTSTTPCRPFSSRWFARRGVFESKIPWAPGSTQSPGAWQPERVPIVASAGAANRLDWKRS